jgi:cytochrome b561
MAKQLHYGTTAKVFHWLIVALLIVQFPLGWFLPDIHHGVKRGDAMTFHISFGITILALIVLRFFVTGMRPPPRGRAIDLRYSLA